MSSSSAEEGLCTQMVNFHNGFAVQLQLLAAVQAARDGVASVAKKGRSVLVQQLWPADWNWK